MFFMLNTIGKIVINIDSVKLNVLEIYSLLEIFPRFNSYPKSETVISIIKALNKTVIKISNIQYPFWSKAEQKGSLT